MASRPDRLVLAAFLVFVVLAGANAIGVRFALREMGPRGGVDNALIREGRSGKGMRHEPANAR